MDIFDAEYRVVEFTSMRLAGMSPITAKFKLLNELLSRIHCYFDPNFNTVYFRRPDGGMHMLHQGRDVGAELAKNWKPSDSIEFLLVLADEVMKERPETASWLANQKTQIENRIQGYTSKTPKPIVLKTTNWT